MPAIVYYVATSLDGYIAGPNDDISGFQAGQPAIDHYLADLQNFSTVIMGRRTYEFGYRFGLAPGQPAYPHMEHYIFSNTLELPDAAPNVHIEPRSLERVRAISDAANTDVYCCGGGVFAGWLLKHGLIDRLKIKLNPFVQGEGIRLFGDAVVSTRWRLTDTETFQSGLVYLTYEREG